MHLKGFQVCWNQAAGSYSGPISIDEDALHGRQRAHRPD